MVHGHDCYLTKDLKSPIWGKTTQERLNRTNERHEYLKKQGFEIIVKWECEFRKECVNDKSLVCYLERFKRPLDKKLYLTEENIIEAVENDQVLGAIEVDISVPKELYDTFQEFCPIFVNADVKFEDIGEHMQDYVKEKNLSTKTKRLLLGVMKAKKVLLATPLLKWYLQHGLRVTKIYQLIEFDLDNRPFKNFVDKVTDDRRKGDLDPNKSILAMTSKLIGNCAYGSSLMRKQHHRDVVFSADKEKVCKLINDKRFVSLNELDDGYCEIMMLKKKITMDVPITIGFFILQYSKLRLLSFMYEFIDRYFDRSTYELIQCDTDSLYIAFSDSNLENLIKRDMIDDYEKNVNKWLPRKSPKEATLYDNRKPGLFKLEYEGHVVVALNSKMYSVYNRDEKHTKFSSKGVSKKHVKEPTEMYKSVLQTKETKVGSNTGFRIKDGSILTYTQNRSSFTYYYIKRRVLPDGIHTTYLDIEPVIGKL